MNLAADTTPPGRWTVPGGTNTGYGEYRHPHTQRIGHVVGWPNGDWTACHDGTVLGRFPTLTAAKAAVEAIR